MIVLALVLITAAWLALVVFVVAVCRASARSEDRIGRSGRALRAFKASNRLERRGRRSNQLGRRPHIAVHDSAKVLHPHPRAEAGAGTPPPASPRTFFASRWSCTNSPLFEVPGLGSDGQRLRHRYRPTEVVALSEIDAVLLQHFNRLLITDELGDRVLTETL